MHASLCRKGDGSGGVTAILVQAGLQTSPFGQWVLLFPLQTKKVKKEIFSSIITEFKLSNYLWLLFGINERKQK